MDRKTGLRGVFVLAVVVMLMMAFAPMAGAADNLIVNGDFESGNTGFTTDYTLNGEDGKDLYDPGVYDVGTSPRNYHSAWADFGDHTSGTGKMMIVNAASDGDPGDLVVWGQEVTLVGTESAPISYPLFAGQDWLVGDVVVYNTATEVCVTLELNQETLDAHYRMTEVHVDFGATVDDIPQTKKFNPIPGHFEFNDYFAPGVPEADEYCADIAGAAVIAAHAVVERPEISHIETHDFCAYSGTDARVGTSNAALAWVHPAWDANMTENLNAGPADWIWATEYVSVDEALNGGSVDLTHDFTVLGTPTAATLKIAADNAFAWHLNGSSVVAENLAGDVVIDPLVTGWSQVYTYDVLADVTSGSNTLYVTGVNAPWDATPTENPAAVIYQLCGTSEERVVDYPYHEESAWGAVALGENQFEGNNWATYIDYEIQALTRACFGTYRFSMWGASSYPVAPAQLFINGAWGGNLDLSATSGEWLEFTNDWNNSAGACLADIEIRDFRNEFNGDDFAIDDISMVKLP